MKDFVKFMCILIFVKCVIGAPPIILKESSPSGQSVVPISSSDPNDHKYFASASASQQHSFGKDGGSSVHSFSIATPERTIVGTGRSFGTPSVNNPFFVPFLVTPEGFDLNWLRNLETFYDPKFNANGVTSVTAINDNGHVYGKINNVPFDNRAKNL